MAPEDKVSSLSSSRLAGLEKLRQGLRDRQSILAAEASVLPLGIPAIDEVLGGGLPCGMLHEIAAAESDIAPATAFALMLGARTSSLLSSEPWSASREDRKWGEFATRSSISPQGRRREPREEGPQASPGSIVWIAEDMGLAESGVPYAPGIDEIGLAPERLITVCVPKSRDVIWAMEEALRCRAVGAVIGEVRNQARLDLVITRRLSLAASRGYAAGLLVRASSSGEPSAAATRWIVSPQRSRSIPQSLGPPSLLLRLMRNRRGRLGSWKLEWNRAEQCFESSAHLEPVAQSAVHRPPRAAVA
jgi:protein ImuA